MEKGARTGLESTQIHVNQLVEAWSTEPEDVEQLSRIGKVEFVVRIEVIESCCPALSEYRVVARRIFKRCDSSIGCDE